MSIKRGRRFLRISILGILGVCCLLPTQVQAQCAMCRATLENNVRNGEDLAQGIGLNGGILYLFLFPYLLLGGLVWLWHVHSKKNNSAQDNTQDGANSTQSSAQDGAQSDAQNGTQINAQDGVSNAQGGTQSDSQDDTQEECP